MFFLRAAITEDASSGSDVPIATMVKPMIMSLTWKICAGCSRTRRRAGTLRSDSTRPVAAENRPFDGNGPVCCLCFHLGCQGIGLLSDPLHDVRPAHQAGEQQEKNNRIRK
ncbi:MAG: hypothetical protein U5J62_07490 [Desulfurivibrio sp.]|nr:hypothetical protein [Desulfurivibrio sp.]